MAKKALIQKQQAKPKFKVRGYTRCRRCGRPRSVYRKFGLCRICLRELVHAGEERVQVEVADLLGLDRLDAVGVPELGEELDHQQLLGRDLERGAVDLAVPGGWGGGRLSAGGLTVRRLRAVRRPATAAPAADEEDEEDDREDEFGSHRGILSSATGLCPDDSPGGTIGPPGSRRAGTFKRIRRLGDSRHEWTRQGRSRLDGP